MNKEETTIVRKRMILNKLNKKAQVTIFIILALAIVAVAIVLFAGRESFTNIFIAESPINQIKDCINDVAQQGIDLLSSQGGSIVPDNYYLYQGNKVEYLCYTNEYYEACVMQKPMLKNSVERELNEFIEPKVLGCMNAVKSSVQKKGYTMTFEKPEVSVELVPNNIFIDVKSDLSISKTEVESYKSFKTNLPSNLYDLVITANSIASFEAVYGDTEIMTYMMYSPSLKVEKKKQGDGTKIYILTNRNSLNKFMFASRSAVIPSGVIGDIGV